MKKIILAIDGMTCSACSNGLEKYLNKQKGIENASVNLVMSNVVISYDENLLGQENIEEFVSQAGFKSLGEFKEIKMETKSEKDKIIFIVFSLLAIFILYIGMGHMISLPIPSFINPHIKPNNYTITLLLLTIPFIIYGCDILKNGYKNLIHKTPNMDTLVAIGVISSFLYSLYSMYMILKGHSDYTMNLYFESTAIVIYFIKLGRYVDAISKDKTKEAIRNLVKITPNDATIKVGDKEIIVTIDEINEGDTVVSKPGERIAVDGEIIRGKSHIDESLITGESKPVTKKVGDKVVAGSINFDGYLEYKALKIGKDSTISEIVRLVIEASNTKAPIAKVADKVSGLFVPIVIVLAIVTFISYLVIGENFSNSLETFVTILVVACPCSLGLATPLAIVVSEGLCASNGILVKKSEILENASKINTIVFDKTGTLTYGQMRISKILNYSNMSDKELLQLVGSLENKSTHPIKRAFINYMDEQELSFLEVDEFENMTGLGIVGKIKKELIIIGNSKILKKYNINNKYLKEEEKLIKKGNTIIYVAKKERIIALIGVNDIVRENASEIISSLNKQKIETIMLTGDNEKTAQKIAEDIGITKVISNVLPKAKSNVIKNLKQKNNYVMMCGDGINDSPALSISDIGVSLNSGTDIAMDSADVILTKNDLKSIISLMNISKKTLRNIKQNLFWAFFYNILMIPIAMGLLKPLGISINPMIASVAMVFSSITVILNPLRLRKIKL